MILWKGHHSADLKDLLAKAWANQELIILCPPTLKDFSFLTTISAFGETSLELAGQFTAAEESSIRAAKAALSKVTKISARSKPLVGVFTSGTLSGKPRMVLYSRENIESSLSGIRSFFDTTQIEEIFCYPPPFHTFGLILGYYHAILHGLKLTVPSGRYSRESHALRSTLQNPKLLTLGTPSHFYDLLEHAKKTPLSESYTAIIGGAKVSVPLWTQIQTDLKIKAPSIGYGATEACPGVTHHPPGQKPSEEGEIGHALPGVSILSMGERGLHFTGPNVCLAVVEQNELQFPKSIVLQDFVEERKADGMLLFRGRLGLLLNRGGTKYSLETLEDLFKKELGLACVCITVPDDRLGEDLGVVIAKDSGPNSAHPQSIDVLRVRMQTLLQKEFQHQFQLSALTTIESIPLNENGKIDRTQISKIISAS